MITLFTDAIVNKEFASRASGAIKMTKTPRSAFRSIAPFDWRRARSCEIYCATDRLFCAFKVTHSTVWWRKLEKYNSYHYNGRICSFPKHFLSTYVVFRATLLLSSSEFRREHQVVAQTAPGVSTGFGRNVLQATRKGLVVLGRKFAATVNPQISRAENHRRPVSFDGRNFSEAGPALFRALGSYMLRKKRPAVIINWCAWFLAWRRRVPSCLLVGRVAACVPRQREETDSTRCQMEEHRRVLATVPLLSRGWMFNVDVQPSKCRGFVHLHFECCSKWPNSIDFSFRQHVDGSNGVTSRWTRSKNEFVTHLQPADT